MRIGVTGSRAWPSESAVWDALSFAAIERVAEGGTLTVMHGACRSQSGELIGADRYAHTWCALPPGPLSITVIEEQHPADWNHCHRSCTHAPRFHRDGTPFCPMAGPRRNAEMIAAGADLFLAFPLPGARSRSRGTWNCVRAARAADIPVEVIRLDFQPEPGLFTSEESR